MSTRDAMSKLDIKLPDPLKAFVEKQVAQCGYEDANDYMRELIEADRRKKLREELEPQLLAAARGPSEEMTDDDWKAARQEGLCQIKQRKNK
jgi:antitoxin ParD1/3/4